MPLDAQMLGVRLERARLARGLSQEEVAASTGLQRSAISRIESGNRGVRSLELAQLTRLYGIPAAALLLEPEPAIAFEHFRAVDVDEAARSAIVEATNYCTYYAWLEHAAFGAQRYELPIYPLPPGRAIEQGEYLANQERNRLGLGLAAINSVVAVLEGEGVKVQVVGLPDSGDVSGCYFFSKEVGPCVVINEGEPPSRRRFTAAHEYAHFLVDREESPAEVCAVPRKNDIREMRANAFAASFLLPADGVDAFLRDKEARRGEVRAEHIALLAHHFGVSYEAVLWRLLNLGWLNRDDRDRLTETAWPSLAAALGHEGQVPGENETAPGRFRSIAIEAWRNEEISFQKLADLVDLPQAELRKSLDSFIEPRKPQSATPAEPDWL